VFVVEGIKLAVVVTSVAGKMTQRRQRFETPEAALTWARQHHAGLVYSPASDLAQN
jgi:hypothetical protein